MAELPGRPASEKPEHLNFEPSRRMVRWLSPRQLAGTALQVALSQIFGAYSDKREIQACLPAGGPFTYATRSEIWIDYVADLGDAFEPTYTIASLLAQPELDVSLEGGQPWHTRRGQALIMGGDQAYPTASVRAYEDRLVGPYRAALPYLLPEPLDLYVIPGNHDWYDGLTAFMRTFCRAQHVGGWKTHQSRSYFSVQLPHRWWLWGIDVQLDSYIDEPQFRYFEEVRLDPGDSIILCSPMPSWVRANEGEHPEAYVTLDYFERKLITPRRAVVRLGLTGDSHHYARYVAGDGESQKITAGGGGAFLSETHHLPKTLQVPPKGSKDPNRSKSVEYHLGASFPDQKTSRRLRWRVAALPFLNLSFWALIGGVYLAYAWMIQAAARGDGDFATVMKDSSFAEVVGNLLRSPLAILVTVALAAGLVGFTKSKKPRRFALGLSHALGHVVLIAAVIWASADVASGVGASGAGFVAMFVVLVGVVGGLLGSWLMAAYLLVADRFALNGNELFASQRNRDYKCFVRLHVGPDGNLTVYPVGVRHTCRRWKLRQDGVDNEPWFSPAKGTVQAELIENPIRIERSSG